MNDAIEKFRKDIEGLDIELYMVMPLIHEIEDLEKYRDWYYQNQEALRAIFDVLCDKTELPSDYAQDSVDHVLNERGF